MIAISHMQAKRLIQAAADGQPVPQEQWAQMQAHLEGCAECCAYAQELAALENGLRRALSARWASAPDVPSGMTGAITAQLSRSHQPQRVQSILGMAAILLLAVLIFGPGRLFPAPQPPPRNEITATPTPAPSPTPTPVDFKGFHGVVLYESRQDGNGEIYLLNAAGSSSVAKPVNLTNDPADDSDPVWSPDGEWIAFLSNRGGKKEVYAMHISGSRLRQITNSPEITWQGPLDWSSDGKYLALHGSRALTDEDGSSPRIDTNVYLLPLETNETVVGSQRTPVLLDPGGASGPIRFAPNQPWLAFIAERDGTRSAHLYDLESAQTYDFLPNLASYARSASDYSERSIDWAPDGSRLVMTVEGPPKDETGHPSEGPKSEVAMSVDFSYGIHPYIDSLDTIALLSLSQGPPAFYQAASWTPDVNRLTYLSADEPYPSCLTLHLRVAHQKDKTNQAVPGLCVEAGVERANWTGKDGWLVVQGHRPGESDITLWAVKPGSAPSSQPAQGQSPIQAPGSTGHNQPGEPALVQLTTGSWAGVPRLRPSVATPLGLDPQPLIPNANQPPADLARGTDWLLINRQTGADHYSLLEWNPSTGQERELISANQRLSCATYSPDQRQIAYVRNVQADPQNKEDIRSEIWLMDADGQNARQITQEQTNEPLTYEKKEHIYHCPIYWSPDGRTLAVIYENFPINYLAILPLDGSQGQYVYTAGQLLGWTPDGARLLLNDLASIYSEAFYSQEKSDKLLAVDPDKFKDWDSGQGISTLLDADIWANIKSMSFAPDGRHVAVMRQYSDSLPTETVITELLVLDYDPAHPDAELSSQRTLFNLKNVPGDSPVGRLRWLPDGSLIFARMHPVTMAEPSRVEILRYLPADNDLRTLAVLNDFPFDLVCSPDGQWAFYRTQAGAGLIDITRAWESQVSPRPVTLPATDMVDWK